MADETRAPIPIAAYTPVTREQIDAAEPPSVEGAMRRASEAQGAATDVQSLRDLADGWRTVSRRNRYDHDRLLRDDDPGPHMTAIQLEWAAREIERLRRDLAMADIAYRSLAEPGIR